MVSSISISNSRAPDVRGQRAQTQDSDNGVKIVHQYRGRSRGPLIQKPTIRHALLAAPLQHPHIGREVASDDHSDDNNDRCGRVCGVNDRDAIVRVLVFVLEHAAADAEDDVHAGFISLKLRDLTVGI